MYRNQKTFYTRNKAEKKNYHSAIDRDIICTIPKFGGLATERTKYLNNTYSKYIDEKNTQINNIRNRTIENGLSETIISKYTPEELQNQKKSLQNERQEEITKKISTIELNTEKAYLEIWKEIIKQSEDILKYNELEMRFYIDHYDNRLYKFTVGHSTERLFFSSLVVDKELLINLFNEDEIRYICTRSIHDFSERWYSIFKVSAYALEKKVASVYNNENVKTLKK